MRILITGGAGWIGRYVTESLGAHDLVLLDRVDPSEATVFDPHAPGQRRKEPLDPSVPYVRADLADDDALAQAMTGVDVIVHLAAMPTGGWDVAIPVLEANVLGTAHVFEAARATGVRRIVNASSINAFGVFYGRVSSRPPVHASLPLTEARLPEPEEPYGLSKAITEQLGAAYVRAFGMEVANLRFASVWAEEKYDEAIAGGLGPTTEWRNDLFQWVHVRDVAQAVAAAVTVEEVAPPPLTICAADTKAPEPTWELIERFRPELAGSITEPLPGRSSLVSIAGARTALGYRPRFTLHAAVRPVGG
jgi:nucleoside-diphosphate-sugar epimerase